MWSGMINILPCKFLLDSGQYQGSFGLTTGILAGHTVSPKYKPCFDQSRPIFSQIAQIPARLHMIIGHGNEAANCEQHAHYCMWIRWEKLKEIKLNILAYFSWNVLCCH